MRANERPPARPASRRDLNPSGAGSTAEIVEHRLWLARSARHIPCYLQRVGADGPLMWFCRRLEADESIVVTYRLAGTEPSHGAL